MIDNKVAELIQQFDRIQDTQARLKSAYQQIQQLSAQLQSIKLTEANEFEIQISPSLNQLKRQLKQQSFLQNLHKFKQKIILQKQEEAFLQYQKILSLIKANQVNPTHKFQVDFLYDLFLNMLSFKSIQGCKNSIQILKLLSKHHLLVQNFFKSKLLSFKNFLNKQLNRVVLLDQSSLTKYADQAVQRTISAIKQFKDVFKEKVEKQPNLSIYASQFIIQMRDQLTDYLQGLLVIQDKSVQVELRKILLDKLSEAQLQGIKFNS